jgi:tyrosine-protein kinase Etk/Wzc
MKMQHRNLTSADIHIPHPPQTHSVPVRTPLRAAPPNIVSSAPDLVSYVTLMAQHVRLIVGCTAAFLLAALVWLLWTPQVYESSMLFHVEEDSPAAQRNMVSDLSTAFDKKAAPLAEIELLRSRLVVGAAVDQLQLAVTSQPRYFPVLGALSARYGGRAAAAVVGGYVWGRQAVLPARFEVPDAWLGESLRLTVLDGQHVRLDDPFGRKVLEGPVGTELEGQGSAGKVRLRIGQLDALPGAQFEFVRRPRQTAVDDLQKALEVNEQGKQSGILDVRLEGTDALLTGRTLAAVGQAFAGQNLARKQEEAGNELDFVSQKLPALAKRLDDSEERLRMLRSRYGSIDLAEEARLGLQRTAWQRQRHDELQQKRIDLLVGFTAVHPQLVSLDKQIAAVDRSLAEQAAYLRSLPLLEQEEGRLLREIRQDSDLVGSLGKTAEQLRIVAMGRVSNVRLVDPAQVPEHPVRPRAALTLAWAAVTGLFLGLLAAFTRHSWRGAITNSAAVASMLGRRAVYASIPHSSAVQGRRRGLLAWSAPADPAIEGLRSFRAALLYAMPHFHNNVVLLCSPGPHSGQSFVLSNVAALLGAAGKRVLLLDANLARGRLHYHFQLAATPGLDDLLAGTMPLDHVLHRQVSDGVDFIASGQRLAEHSEHLVHLNFGELLVTLSRRYDVVLVGSAPVLDSADALTIGSHAGAVFVLTRAGVTRADQLREAVLRLNQAGIAPQGVLCNDLAARLGESRGQAAAQR